MEPYSKPSYPGKNPKLFNLQGDPGERFNRAEDHPDIVREIRQKMGELADEVGSELPESWPCVRCLN